MIHYSDIRDYSDFLPDEIGVAQELTDTQRVRKSDIAPNGVRIDRHQPGLVYRQYRTVKAFQRVFRPIAPPSSK